MSIGLLAAPLVVVAGVGIPVVLRRSGGRDRDALAGADQVRVGDAGQPVRLRSAAGLIQLWPVGAIAGLLLCDPGQGISRGHDVHLGGAFGACALRMQTPSDSSSSWCRAPVGLCGGAAGLWRASEPVRVVCGRASGGRTMVTPRGRYWSPAVSWGMSLRAAMSFQRLPSPRYSSARSTAVRWRWSPCAAGHWIQRTVRASLRLAWRRH